MSLIGKITSYDGGIISTYKTLNGKKVEVLVHEISGIKPRKRIKLYDNQGTLEKCIDIRRTGKDVYTKAEDGSTLLTHEDQKTLLPYLSFSELIQRFFK